MKKNVMDLADGKLKLHFLRDGKLVLGKYTGAPVSKKDLISALQKLGVVSGYIDNSISLVSNGSYIQLPIAKAIVEEEPGKLDFPFMTKRDAGFFLQFITTGRPIANDISEYVNKDQTLVRILENSKRILKMPDGKRSILGELEKQDLFNYAGTNTYINEELNTVHAATDGIAHKNQYGTVTVSPATQVKSIGKAHGKVYYEASLTVTADIRSESEVESTSNIIVNGMIHSSTIHSGGNVQAKFGLDNIKKIDKSMIRAGQSVFSTTIRNYKVFAGEDVLASTLIQDSIVKALCTVASPRIKDSDISVGGTVYVRHIEGKSRIYLGSYFVNESDTNSPFKYFKQHEKRLNDLDTEIHYLKDRLLHDKQMIINQFKKLKRLNGEYTPEDIHLSRFYKNQTEALNQLKKKIKQYEEQIQVVLRDRMRVSYYEKQFLDREPVRLIVKGNISSGTVIHAPGDKIVINEMLSDVTIFADPFSGKLKIIKNS